jgi:hypothetical protein
MDSGDPGDGCSDPMFASSHAECGSWEEGCAAGMYGGCFDWCSPFGDCSLNGSWNWGYGGDGSFGSGLPAGSGTTTSSSSAPQPPLAGMGNAMFGGLVTCTNAQVIVGGVQYPVGPTTCGLTPFGVLGLWGGTMMLQGRVFASTVAQNFVNEFRQGGCVNTFFEGVDQADILGPLLNGSPNIVETNVNAAANSVAVGYAASNLLTVPFRSSVVRNILETGENSAEGFAPFYLNYMVVSGMGKELAAMHNGGCD